MSFTAPLAYITSQVTELALKAQVNAPCHSYWLLHSLSASSNTPATVRPRLALCCHPETSPQHPNIFFPIKEISLLNQLTQQKGTKYLLHSEAYFQGQGWKEEVFPPHWSICSLASCDCICHNSKSTCHFQTSRSSNCCIDPCTFCTGTAALDMNI